MSEKKSINLEHLTEKDLEDIMNEPELPIGERKRRLESQGHPQKYKGLPAGIYRNKNMPDCSNHGLSSKFDNVLVIMDEPDSQVFNSSDELPAVRIVRRTLFGREYVHAEPVAPGNYMFGGTYITACDSRFSRYVSRYPIALHDRQERNNRSD